MGSMMSADTGCTAMDKSGEFSQDYLNMLDSVLFVTEVIPSLLICSLIHNFESCKKIRSLVVHCEYLKHSLMSQKKLT